MQFAALAWAMSSMAVGATREPAEANLWAFVGHERMKLLGRQSMQV
jgi:hypothetical protein